MPALSVLSDDHRSTLRSSAALDGLPHDVQADIVSAMRWRRLNAGQLLFVRGDRPNGLFCVLEGIVRVSGSNKDGRETWLDLYGPGSWIGEVSTLAGGRRLHDCTAHSEALLLQLLPQPFETLLARHPAFSRTLLRLEAQRLAVLLTALESYSTQTLDQRLASRLLRLAEQYAVATPQGLEITLPLSHETLARLIGSTRQRVSQTLLAWHRDEIVRRQRRHLVVLHRTKLEDLARL